MHFTGKTRLCKRKIYLAEHEKAAVQVTCTGGYECGKLR